MNINNVISKRRSCRNFLEKAVPDHVIGDMLQAARLAPTAGNAQSHVFGVVKDTHRKKRLAKAAGEQMWIANAPLIFACCADISWDIKAQPKDDFGLIVNELRFGRSFTKYLSDFPDRRRAKTFLHNGTPIMPCAQMFLVAASHGLGACIVGYLDVERASKILKLPDHMACLFLMPVGYPAREPEEKARKTIDEIVFYETWTKEK